MQLSTDQQNVIDALRLCSVIVEANPGAGKTTTACSVAHAFPDWKTCLLTYSSRLKEETRARAVREDINTLKVHSYHSFARWATNLDGFTDVMLHQATKHAFRPECEMDLLILDEQQDQTWLYWKLVCRIIAEFNPARVLVLGDSRQCVFMFKGADSRFLTCSREILNLPTKTIHLSTSFRVTRQIADFVNTALLRRNEECPNAIRAARDGPLVTVCTCNIWSWGLQFLDFVTNHIRSYGFGNTFILAPSVRLVRTQHIATLQEHLVANGIPVYFPLFEDGLGKDEAMRNKVVFSSFHGAKGRERDLVFVLSFDESYGKYYDRNGDASACSNAVYVAMTRAKEKLVVIRGHRQKFPAYVDVDTMNRTCEMKTFQREYITPGTDTNGTSIKKSTTELVAHLTDSTTAHLDALIQSCFKAVESNQLNVVIPTSTCQDGGEEEVSTITSLLINSEISRECIESSFIDAMIDRFTFHSRDEMFNGIPNRRLIISHVKAHCDGSVPSKLKRVLIYNAIVNRESFRLAQIQKYDWISQKQLSKCVQGAKDNLDITASAQFEHMLSRGKCNQGCQVCAATMKDFGVKMHITATLDVVTDTSVIENKATTEASLEHFLQVVVYSYLWKVLKPEVNKRFILYYQLSGDMHELAATHEQIKEIMHVLIKAKSEVLSRMPDSEFIQKARDIRSKYESKYR